MKSKLVGVTLASFLGVCLAPALFASDSPTRPGVVSVRATVPLATEPAGQEGQFTISRTGSTNSALTIFLRAGGTATNGVDYESTPSSVTLAAGQISTNIAVVPVAESAATHFKTVVLSLPRAHTNDYAVGFASSAKVFIVYNYTNIAPDVKILSPTNGSVFLALPNLALSAFAGDSNGWVTTVEFFANGASIGVASNSAPGPVPLSELVRREEHNLPFPGPDWPWRNRYDVTWSAVAPGSYDLAAVATDNAGLQTTSAPVSITVSTNLPTPQTKILTPLNGATFFAQTPVNILAEAGESGGAINTVEFFGNGSSLGLVTNSSPVAGPHPSPEWFSGRPYFFRWTNDVVGSNTLYTIATDANGTTATSTFVNINVITNLPRHRW